MVYYNHKEEREDNKMTKTEKERLNEMVEILKAQDKELQRIFAEREEIAKQAEAMGRYDELWEMLYSDGESHYVF